jgi:hypothetical protein
VPGHPFEMTMSEESYNIYSAIYAMAHILHEMLLHQIEKQPMGNGKEIVFFPFTGKFFFNGWNTTGLI